jgi:hypothetical protein
MLKIVMANPMQFTMVKAVPLYSRTELCATSVENNGESAITTMPQKIRKLWKTMGVAKTKKSGDNRQQQQLLANAAVATGFAPHFWERYPAATQAGPPTPIIKKDKTPTGDWNVTWWCWKLSIRKGIKAQRG